MYCAGYLKIHKIHMRWLGVCKILMTGLPDTSKRRARGRSAPGLCLCWSGPATLRSAVLLRQSHHPPENWLPPRKAQPQPPNPPPQSWGRGALTCGAAVVKAASLAFHYNAAPAPARIPARVGLPARCQG